MWVEIPRALFTVAIDDGVPTRRRVDPHHWAERLKNYGFTAQLQPAFTPSDGSVLPRTTHLTITPVMESRLAGLQQAMAKAAGDVRGVPGIDPQQLLCEPDGPMAAGCRRQWGRFWPWLKHCRLPSRNGCSRRCGAGLVKPERHVP